MCNTGENHTACPALACIENALPFVDHLLQFPGHLERIVAMHAAAEEIWAATDIGLVFLRPGHPAVVNVCGALHGCVFYQVHSGAKDVEFSATRARILPLTVLAGILKV